MVLSCLLHAVAYDPDLVIFAVMQVKTEHPLRHVFNPNVHQLEPNSSAPKLILDATGHITVTNIRTTSPCCNACKIHLFNFSSLWSISINQNLLITLPNGTTCDSRACHSLIQLKFLEIQTPPGYTSHGCGSSSANNDTIRVLLCYFTVIRSTQQAWQHTKRYFARTACPLPPFSHFPRPLSI